MRRITTADQDYLLEVSPCTDDEVETFTAGDCWKLAHELHSRGVGELVGVIDSDQPSYWCHMAVKLPDGLYLDANGVQTGDQLLGRWGSFCGDKPAIAIYDLSKANLWEELTGDQDLHLSNSEEVQAVAQMLIDWIDEL